VTEGAGGSGERIHTFGRFLRQRFGFRVQKLVVDAGFTCPNRDGRLGRGGCTYCDNGAFSPATARRDRSVAEQVRSEASLARERYGAREFIAYFQAFTNTYAPVERLERLYREALSVEGVVGLSIGTRPDCVPDAVLDLLERLARETHVWVEYGLQSAHDETLRRVHRGHAVADFDDAVRRTQGRGLFVCAHLILGLPGETPAMMRATADHVAAFGIDGVKTHHLHVVRGTNLEQEWRSGKVETLSLEAYASLAADTLERLPPWCVLQRFCGDVQGEALLAPLWGVGKLRVLEAIEGELERRGARQGAHYVGPTSPPGWESAERRQPQPVPAG